MEERYIADGLVAIRTQKNVSVEELAEALGINVPAYTRYEETLGFTQEEFSILAEELSVNIGDLYHNPEIAHTLIDMTKYYRVDEEREDKSTIFVASPYAETIDKANEGKDPKDHLLFLDKIDFKNI